MSNKLILFATLILIMHASCLMSQEESGFVQQRAIVVNAMDDGEGGASVMTFEMSDADGSLFLTDSLDTDFGFGMGADANSFSMLNNTNVQKDLQLVDEQLEQIQQINKDFGAKIKEKMDLMKDENGNFNFQMNSDFGDLMRKLRQQQRDQISSILLPNQQERLEQVARQLRMKKAGTAKSLSGKLAKELGISADQTRRIRDKSKELEKRLEKQIAELRATAKQELLDELTAEQKKKLTELLGEEFIQNSEDRQRQFRMRRPGSSDSSSGDF